MTEFGKRLITSFFLGSLFWFLFAYLPPIYFSLILLSILVLIIVFEWRRFFTVYQSAYWLTLPFYPVFPFILLIIMNQNPLYHDLLLELFVIVASLDTGSYIIGSVFGKHKICPRISPQKTWEGFIGGYALAVLSLVFIMFYEQRKVLPLWLIMGFTLIICILALCGDLFESWLKRRAHIKHSGTMLPGHGGFLDRFDGILFAVFFFYLFKDQLVRFFD